MPREKLPSGTDMELVLPPGGDPLRGLVIAPDVSGLRPLFDEMCKRLAAENGWVVGAVEPYPDGEQPVDLQARINGPIDVERMVNDLLAAADVLQERTGVERVAILGFCQGGMSAFRAAGTGRFDKAVAFYGMIKPPPVWASPGSDPLDALRSPECCPVLAIIGGRDTYTPSIDVDEAKAAGAHVAVRVYDEAEHGFVHDPSRPNHRSSDAADAWRWVVEFLA